LKLRGFKRLLRRWWRGERRKKRLKYLEIEQKLKMRRR